MARISPAVASKRARVAGLTVGVKTGKRRPDDAELKAAYGDLAYEQLAEHAEKVVAGWPPATDEQLQRIAAILRNASPPGLTTESASGGSTAPRHVSAETSSKVPQSRTELVETRLAELDGGA